MCMRGMVVVIACFLDNPEESAWWKDSFKKRGVGLNEDNRYRSSSRMGDVHFKCII